MTDKNLKQLFALSVAAGFVLWVLIGVIEYTVWLL